VWGVPLQGAWRESWPAAVERTWTTTDIQGQILALTWASFSMKVFESI